MRLIALELENFRQYAHARVAFEQGITAIVGANGAGKTTLVEAILWALYGAGAVRETTSTLRFLWSQGGAKVRVTLEFELGRRRYRLRRGLNEADLAQMNPDGTWLPLARGTTSVNERTQQLLGMNLLQFQTSFCARQKELEFMRYSKEKRREEISRMLGYERITEAVEQATLAMRALDAEVSGLKQAIGDLQSLAQQLQGVELALQQTEADLRQKEADLHQAIQHRDTAKQQLDAQNALREQYLSLTQQRTLLERDHQYAAQRVEELRVRWEQFKHACDRYKAIAPNAQRYRELLPELQQMEQQAQAAQQRAQLQAQRQTLLQQQAQRQAEHAELLQKQSELDALQPHLHQAEQLRQQLQRLRQIAQQAPERARIEAQVQTLQQHLDALRLKETERATLQQAVQEAETALQQRQQALSALEAELQSVLQAWNQQRADADAHARSLSATLQQQRERIAQLESLGAESNCPTCGQPLGEAYHAVLQQAKAEALATEHALRTAQQQLKQLEKEPTEARALRTRLAQLQQERDHAQQQLAHQQAQLRQLETEIQQADALEKQIRALQRQLARIPQYDPNEEAYLQQALDALRPTLQQAQQLQGELRRLHAVERELQHIARRLAELQRQIDALPADYDAERHNALRQELEQLRPHYEEALALKPILDQRDMLLRQIQDAKAELNEKSTQMHQVEQQIQQLGYEEDAYLQAAHAYQEAEQRVNALERTVAARIAERNSQTALRDHLKAQLEHIAQLQQQLQQKERDLLMHQSLRKALQEFRTELNARLRPTLASIATEFLSTLTNGRYTELEIDEEYRFTIIDEGHRKAVISGGEEDIVNLSLRLALARLITERAGQPLSLLILDEVFASLDAERRQNVMELLNNLRNWFDQILVISHFEEINEAADRCVRVQRNPLTRASELIEPELPTLPMLEAEPL
ncbi:MAG: AAA family ATPase [Fimbriimonadales bacterium]